MEKDGFTPELQQQLIDKVLEGGDITSLIYMLGEAIGKPVAFYNSSGKLSACQVSHCFANFFSPNKLPKGPEYFIVPVQISSTTYGWIVVLIGEDELSLLEISTVNQLALALAMDLYYKTALKTMQHKLRDEFLYDLLNNRMSTREYLLHNVKAYQIPLDCPKLVVIFDTSKYSADYTKKMTEFTDIELAEQDLAAVFFWSMGTRIGNQLVFILDGSVFYNKRHLELTSELNAIRRKLTKVLDDPKLLVGIGRYYTDPADLAKSYTEARIAIDLGKNVACTETVLHYNEMIFYRILSSCTNLDELQAIYNETLNPLIVYEKKRNTELIPTLEQYIAADGSIKETAKRMYLHYNTVKYRISQIEEIMSIDLHNPETKFNIAVALKINQYINKKIECKSNVNS